MATRNESLRYNKNSVYPAAGYNIIYAKFTSVSSTLLTSDCLVEVDTGTSVSTQTLPTSPYVGEQHQVYDWRGNASVYNITVKAAGSDLINGAGSVVIATNFGSVTVRWNGTQWIVVGRV